MPGTTYRDTAYWVAPRSTRRTNKAQWRSTTSRTVRRTADSEDDEDPDELVRSLGSPGCEWKEGIDAVNRFGTRYTALLCHLFQSGELPGHLLQKILVVRTETDFAQPSVEPTVNWLSRPLMFKELTGAHARECLSCRSGGPERLSLTAAKNRFRSVLSTMQTYLTLPRHLAWGAELSQPRLAKPRMGCSVSRLRSQVEMWGWATYQALNGLLWRYAEAVNDVRSDWSRAVRSREYDTRDDRFRNEERAHAKTCLNHLRAVLLRTEEGSTHDRSLLQEVSHGSDHGADLWLLEHAKCCPTCARHPTLNEALWTDDHGEDYKPWRNHPAWLDASAIKRSVGNLDTVRAHLEGELGQK